METKTRNFDEWLSGFRTSIADYRYYVDFGKVFENVQSINVELNILNSLIGKQNIESEFITLVAKYPEILKCVPILIAKREKEIPVLDTKGAFVFNFKDMNYDVQDYVYFMRETGLFELLKDRNVTNIVDYVTGVEAGLDSHRRKNRGGHLMENLVEQFIKEAGFVKGESYFKEMYSNAIVKKWNINLSTLSNEGKTSKRFDFVIKTNSRIYAIETNFYASDGSKLNETSRSYKTLAEEARNIPNFVFMWITDGQGWHSARHNLEETFGILPTLYNIKDMEAGLFVKLKKEG